MRLRTRKPKYATLTIDDANDKARRDELLLQHGFDMSKGYLVRYIDRHTRRFTQWQDSSKNLPTS